MLLRVACIFCALALRTEPVFANPYLAELISRAHVLKLSEDAQWHALLHYRNNLIVKGVTGQADDAAFYLAVDGKTNPEAELDATLTSFFDPAVVDTDTQQHPQCRFIARYHWLKETLQFDATRIVGQSCARYSAWRTAIKPDNVTLVFPAAYVNNPSSMFGHTLLRIDHVGQDAQTRLLSYAVNYEANPGGEGGATFIFKSLVGKYPGRFSILPYYAKVKDYSQLESRDIWEYQLNFTAEEVDRLMKHVWELRAIRFDYYFFDENCAYHLLSLFEVARPSLKLTRHFNGWVIPLDTVRVLAEQSGMVRDIVFRPAENTKLRYQLSQLSHAERSAVLNLSREFASELDGDLAGIPAERKSVVLEAAYGFLRMQSGHGNIDAVSSTSRSRELLLARSHLPALDRSVLPPKPDIAPEQAHRTRRLGVTVEHDGFGAFHKIGLRPAYHDLLDPQGGYALGAQISFLDAVLRVEPTNGAVSLDQLSVVDIFSLFPRDEFFRPVSWRLSTGFTHAGSPRERRALYRNQAGAGLSWGFAHSAQWYGFIDGTADVGSDLERNYAVGAGGSVGIYAHPSNAWQLHCFVKSQQFEWGDKHREHVLALEQSFSLGQQHAIKVGMRREQAWGDATSYFSVGWYSYW